MSLLGFLGKLVDRIAPEIFEFNPYNLHPQVATAVAYCDGRQWRELGRLYESLDHFQTHLITEGLSEIIKDDAFFDEWCEKSRGYYLPHLLRGSLLLKRAWVYRGYGRADDVEEQRWPKFYDALEESLDSLTAAMNTNPDIIEAPARAIRTLMGLSAEWDDIDAMHARLKATGQPSFFGEVSYLIASCEKWLGSHDKMFEFARNTYAGANHPSYAGLIAEAHFEKHMYLRWIDDDADGAAAYFDDPAIQSEISEASETLLADAAERPAHETLEAHGYFAMVFSIAEQFKMAAPHFEIMGTAVSRHPWEFDDVEFLARSRRKSLAYL